MEQSATSLCDEADFEQIREKFPGARDKVYLNVAGRGLLSNDVRAALDKHLDELRDGAVDKAAYFAQIERVRGKFAQLIGAIPDEVAFTKNVSDGLNIIAASIPWAAGDNVILCGDLEHPNNVYPWLNVRYRHGVEIRMLPHQDGIIDTAAMIASMDESTRLVSISTVTLSPGFRTDIAPLAQACRERDIFLLVDAAQSVGVLDLNVQTAMIDGLAVATQKGLLGLYGMGFLYCRGVWAKRIRPAALARFSVDLGQAKHEAAVGGLHYDLMPGAKRFDIGNYNFPAACALEPSLDLLLGVGTRRIENYVCSLSAKLASGLHELGLPVCGGLPGPHSSHIVTLGRYSSDADDVPSSLQTQSLCRYLQLNDVCFTVRKGLLRFSLHLYNNQADVEQTLNLVREGMMGAD